MELLTDPIFLARFQFAATVIFHFVFVPLSIGIGLMMALNETRYYRTRDPKDAGATGLWVKIFAACFIVGVATGITMEFSFGTNWADYARFVGDIFGAPLAAEALFAFFLESVFLGILIFGRNRVSPRFYMVSAWLVWFGSCLSALWILIANSWMQTPAGGELSADGSRAVITDFFAAAFNPSLASRYFHTVFSVLAVGAFIAMAISAWYMYKKRHPEFALRTMRTGSVVGIVAMCLLLVSAHASAVVVSEEQPTKFALMEGMYDSEVPPLYLAGWVDEATQEVFGLGIPGGSSFLATGTWDTEFEGLNELAQTQEFDGMVVEEAPANLVFQSYHIMVLLFGVIMIVLILALVFSFRGGTITSKKWLQRLLIISPVFPMLAIQAGWLTAEYGRQPWVVYPSTTGPEGLTLLTANGVSQAVSAPEILITLLLFTVVYTLIFIALIRVVFKFIRQGPVLDAAGVGAAALSGGDADDDDESIIEKISVFTVAERDESGSSAERSQTGSKPIQEGE
ncbi:MAG: cytochrome ubiquinol oxidase subunit I [Coriobacteriales bacterium]|jgi:cytochrome d ubiquinol oxidase subunit I|nr:cytochrome ubiquinol oxidase subunit I [Coriobacteriales bacterium]